MPEWVKCLLLSGAGVVLGGFITYLVSRAFYVKAARQLQESTQRLQRSMNVLGQYLKATIKDADVDLVLDRDGNVIGLNITRHLEGNQANTAGGKMVPGVEGDKKPD